MAQQELSREWRRIALLWGGAFFVVGALIHLVLVLRYLRRDPNWDFGRMLARHPAVWVGTGILGGACVALLMVRLLRKTLAGEISGWDVLLRGALYGAAATGLTLELLFLGLSIEVARRTAGEAPFLALVPLFLTEISTYGGELLIPSCLVAVLYGAAGGMACFLFDRSLVARPHVRQTNPSTPILLLGILSVAFLHAIPISLVLGPLGVGLGIRELRTARRAHNRVSWQAIAGTALSTAALLYWFSAIGLSTLFWNRHR